MLVIGGIFLLAVTTAGAASLRGQGDEDSLLSAASSMVAPGEYGEVGQGELINLGHNQHASGLNIHHPKVSRRNI
jgi:hypothetical protein